MKIGYARISSHSQQAGSSLHEQRRALKAEGVEEKDIYNEIASGIFVNPQHRPVLFGCLDRMTSGDVLVVHRLDRFGRSLVGCVIEINKLHERGCFFQIADAPPLAWNDSSVVLHTMILSYLGQKETELRAERTRSGIERAKLQGKYSGRKTKVTKTNIKKIIDLKKKGLSNSQICKLLSLGMTTLQKCLRASKLKAGEGEKGEE